MKAQELIKHFDFTLNSLCAANIPFLLTGTVAINLQGINMGRDPNDLDITTTSNINYEPYGFKNIWDGDDYPEEQKEVINCAIWAKEFKGVKMNILVLQSGKALNKHILTYNEFPIDPLGECLKWKFLLYREKDQNDITYIKTNYLTDNNLIQ